MVHEVGGDVAETQAPRGRQGSEGRMRKREGPVVFGELLHQRQPDSEFRAQAMLAGNLKYHVVLEAVENRREWVHMRRLVLLLFVRASSWNEIALVDSRRFAHSQTVAVGGEPQRDK